MNRWGKLAAACGAAKEPSIKLDRAICLTAGVAIRNVTSSLSDAISLVEETLPGWAWKVGTCCVSDDAWLVPDFNSSDHGARLKEQFGEIKFGSIWDYGIDIDRRPPGNTALALCEAYCSAQAHIEALPSSPHIMEKK